MRDRIEVLWKHYSSWFMWAAGLIEVAMQTPELAPIMSTLPKSTVAVLILLSLVAKTIPQNLKKYPGS